MKNKLKRILKIKFIQDIGFLQISAIIITGFTMITSLVIARVLKPMDFGIYNLALSLCGLVGIFGNLLGLKQTTLLKLSSAYATLNREEIFFTIGHHFKVSLIVGGLIMMFGYISAPYLSRVLYGRQDIGDFSRILFLMPPLIILYKLVAVILEGIRDMKSLAILESASTLITSFTLIILVSLGLGLTALIYGWLFSAILLSILAVFVYQKLSLTERGMPPIFEIVKRFYSIDTRRLLRLNLFTGFSENIIALNDNLPIILLGVFVLPKEVGYFKLGYSMMGLSVLFLEPIARNLLVKLRQLQSNGDIKGLSRTFYKISLLAGISSIIVGTTLIIGFHILIYFFLKDYQPSLRIIYILLLYFSLLGFGIGLSPILRALERLDIEIKVNGIGVLIFIALSICLTKNLGISGIAAALLISGSFTKFITYLLVRKELNKLAI